MGEVPDEFLEHVPLPAVVLDAGGTIVGLNSPFSNLLGEAREVLIGRSGFGFVDRGDRGLVGSLLRGMSGSSHVALAASLLRRDGERVGIQSFWSVLEASPAASPRYLGLFVEMPARDPPAAPGAGAWNDSLPADTSTAETSPGGEPAPCGMDPGKQSQIIHTIIFHDAKNRLAALHGYAALLRESLAGSGFLPYIDRLEEIASDLERDLGVASMLSHLGLIAPRWQNLREVIGRCAARESQGRMLVNELPGSLWCFADPLFPRVFSNLLENARRHGERVTTIRIAAQEGETGLVITVEDDGIGIPADQKERIFEPGFGRHTGYGLYLAREVLAIGGFSIRETGDPGKGARFEIHIPGGRYLHRQTCPEEPGPVRIPAA